MFSRPPQAPTLSQQIFTILWLSFMIAGVATGVFFSLVDPIELGSCVALPLFFPELSRIGAYSIGFLLFWALTSGTCFLSLLFLGTENPGNKP